MKAWWDMDKAALFKLFPIVLEEYNDAYPAWYEAQRAALSVDHRPQ